MSASWLKTKKTHKRKIAKICLIALLVLLLGILLCIIVLAAVGNAGEAQPSGGNCYNGKDPVNFFHDTCYGGISWRFYTVDGDYYDKGKDKYKWDGSQYKAGSTTVSGCNGTDGYWLLAYERYVPVAGSRPYVGSYKNRQYGAAQLKMSAHWSGGYARDASIQGSGFPKLPGKVYTSASDFKRSGMYDAAIGSWDMVADLFDNVPGKYRNYLEWDKNSNLSWFCYKSTWDGGSDDDDDDDDDDEPVITYSDKKYSGNGSVDFEVVGESSARQELYEAEEQIVEVRFTHSLSQSNEFKKDIASEHYEVTTNSVNPAKPYKASENDVKLPSGSQQNFPKVVKVDPLLRIDDGDKKNLLKITQQLTFKSKTWSIDYTYPCTDTYKYVDGRNQGVVKTSCDELQKKFSGPTGSNDTGTADSVYSYVHRPWNFKIAKIESQNAGGIVYSGSTISANDLKFDISVEKNNNSYLITDIPQAKFSLTATLKDENGNHNLGLINIPDQYKITPNERAISDNGNYNYHVNLQNYKATFTVNNATINVPDTKAGNRLCFQLTANRNNSGNGYASNFNGSTTSSEVCYTIAKHPTFQVWGGNFYTAGKVDAYDFAATKNNVDGDNSRPYSFASANDNDNDNDNAISFNPWVELAVVAGNGNAKGLSSGAATAYTWNNGFTQSGNSFCDNHSPLSIAGNCNDDTLGASGATVGGNIKTTLYNRYIADKANVENTTTINGATFNATKIIYSKDNTVTINGNIQASNQAYTSLSEIPVYIIYAKNIDIACSVGQIDAILIADGGAIDTCYGDDDKNSSARSNQLTINGLVIADKLILGRTYGAAYGQNSNIPAEIFNLSPMFYLWSGNETMGEGAKNYIVYTRELAPRY